MLQPQKVARKRAALVFTCLLSLSLLCGTLTSSKTVQAANSTGWQNDGVMPTILPIANSWPFSYNYSCYDATQLNVIIYTSDITSTDGTGTFSFNWKTGQRTKLSTTAHKYIAGYSANFGLFLMLKPATEL